jgi:hypothetical protein
MQHHKMMKPMVARQPDLGVCFIYGDLQDAVAAAAVLLQALELLGLLVVNELSDGVPHPVHI